MVGGEPSYGLASERRLPGADQDTLASPQRGVWAALWPAVAARHRRELDAIQPGVMRPSDRRHGEPSPGGELKSSHGDVE